MNTETLCEKLGATDEQMECLLAEGLPWSGSEARKQFNEQQVVAWLLEYDFAVTKQSRQFVSTARAAAEAVGVPLTTFEKWIYFRGCPHEPRCYDVQAIKAWMVEAQERGIIKPRGDDGKPVQAKRSDSKILDELRRYRLEQAREELVHVEEVRSEVHRQQEIIVKQLAKVGDAVQARLPDGLDETVIKIIRVAVAETVADCTTTVGQLTRWERAARRTG